LGHRGFMGRLMTDNDTYYRQRMADELAAAKAAKDAGVSSVHRDMAQLYRARIGVETRGRANRVEPRTVVI